MLKCDDIVELGFVSEVLKQLVEDLKLLELKHLIFFIFLLVDVFFNSFLNLMGFDDFWKINNFEKYSFLDSNYIYFYLHLPIGMIWFL